VNPTHMLNPPLSIITLASSEHLILLDCNFVNCVLLVVLSFMFLLVLQSLTYSNMSSFSGGHFHTFRLPAVCRSLKFETNKSVLAFFWLCPKFFLFYLRFLLFQTVDLRLLLKSLKCFLKILRLLLEV